MNILTQNAYRFGLLVLLFLGSAWMYAQTVGTPYQAYFTDKNSGYIPGDQIVDVPLSFTDLKLRFEILDDANTVLYTEDINAKTDEFGLLSTVVGAGRGAVVSGDFANIVWDGSDKTLQIYIDFSNTGSQYEKHGTLDLVYIPGPSLVKSKGLSSAVGAPTASYPEDPVAGDICVDNTGDVGIGTTNPTARMHVAGNVGNSYLMRLENTHDTDGEGLLISGKGTDATPLLHINGGTNGSTAVMRVRANGVVTIGSPTIGTNVKLAVQGNITASGTITPDFVFEKYFTGSSTLKEDYQFMPLEEVEQFVATNHHLPGVPSAAEVAQAGGIVINRATELNLEKIEELFLHLIELKKENETLKENLEATKERLNALEKRIKND